MGERERITFNVKWFIKHSHYWDDLSDDTRGIRTDVDNIVMPAGTLDWPGFGGLKAKYTSTAQKISELYGEGTTETTKTSGLLKDAGRSYARTEAGNTAEAQSILAEFDGQI